MKSRSGWLWLLQRWKTRCKRHRKKKNMHMTWWILWFMGNESTVNWCGLVGLLIYIYTYIYIYIYKWGASRCSSVASPYSTSIFVYIADSLINPCTRISSLHYMSIVAASTELTELHHFLGSWHRLTHQLPINGCFFFRETLNQKAPDSW